MLQFVSISKKTKRHCSFAVILLKKCNDKNTLFRSDENDMADISFEYVLEKLTIPVSSTKCNRVTYTFNKFIDVCEK